MASWKLIIRPALAGVVVVGIVAAHGAVAVVAYKKRRLVVVAAAVAPYNDHWVAYHQKRDLAIRLTTTTRLMSFNTNIFARILLGVAIKKIN